MLPHLSPQAWIVMADSGETDAKSETTLPRTVDDIRNLLTEDDKPNGDKDDNSLSQARNKALLRVRAGEIVYVLSKRLV